MGCRAGRTGHKVRAAQLSWEHQNVAEPQECCGSSARQDRVGESTTVLGGAGLADGGRRAQRWHDEPQSDGDRDNGSNSGSLSGSDNDNYGGSLSGSDKGSRLRRTTPEAPLRCPQNGHPKSIPPFAAAHIILSFTTNEQAHQSRLLLRTNTNMCSFQMKKKQRHRREDRLTPLPLLLP